MKTGKAPKPRLSIRYARPEEMGRVWELDRCNLSENWDLHPATDSPLNGAALSNFHRRKYESLYRPDKHKILVAVLDGRIVGLAWYCIQRDPFYGYENGMLYSVVVEPAFRRRGIGRRLVREFMLRVKRAGASYARLGVLHNNSKALNLYRALGFFDEMHSMLARLEPTRPEKAKLEAAERKRGKA